MPVLISRFKLPPSNAVRMTEVEFTRYLTRPATPTGVCHCGTSGLLFPEFGPGAKGQRKLLGWHCYLCRCDEHTPAAHALWTERQRLGKDGSSATTQHPGCGRKCERGVMDALLAEDFPTFKEWVRTNGAAKLRAEGKATPFTLFATYGSGRGPSSGSYDMLLSRATKESQS